MVAKEHQEVVEDLVVGQLTERSPKTLFGVPILQRSRRHRTSQLEDRMKIAGLWNDHDLVSIAGIGTPIARASFITHSFKPLLRRADLPDIRFHDLRHTCATLLLCRGVDAKLVQELLGHSTIAVTLATYSHVLRGIGDGLADMMDEALG